MTDKLRQAAQQILEAVADLTILTPREWQAVHGLKINALRAALAEPAEQGPVAWFDADGKIHGRVSREQLVALCTEALTQLGERYVALADYKELQALVSRQGIRLMEYESQPIEPAGQEPVAWMSPGKERLEYSRKDTVYGSHTIPLYTTPPDDEALLRQALEALEYCRSGEDCHPTLTSEAIDALKERLK